MAGPESLKSTGKLKVSSATAETPTFWRCWYHGTTTRTAAAVK